MNLRLRALGSVINVNVINVSITVCCYEEAIAVYVITNIHQHTTVGVLTFEALAEQDF